VWMEGFGEWGWDSKTAGTEILAEDIFWESNYYNWAQRARAAAGGGGGKGGGGAAVGGVGRLGLRGWGHDRK
jgi:hypothetical protein